MPILTGALHPYGPIIPLKVMPSTQRVEALKRAGKPFAAPEVVQGLIDTGASGFGLDSGLIAKLGLAYHGRTNVHTPSTGPGFEECNQYDVTVIIGENTAKPLSLTLPAISFDFSAQPFKALVGREVLHYCQFTCYGPMNKFSLEFNEDPV
jgi:hypothetical protein